jgi:hypothetical protein
MIFSNIPITQFSYLVWAMLERVTNVSENAGKSVIFSDYFGECPEPTNLAVPHGQSEPSGRHLVIMVSRVIAEKSMCQSILEKIRQQKMPPPANTPAPAKQQSVSEPSLELDNIQPQLRVLSQGECADAPPANAKQHQPCVLAPEQQVT